MAAGEAQVLVRRAKDALSKERDVRLAIDGWQRPLPVKEVEFEAGSILATQTNGTEYVFNSDAVQAVIIYPDAS